MAGPPRPALFGGGQGNLYVYVANNPVNLRDPLGLFCVRVTAYWLRASDGAGADGTLLERIQPGHRYGSDIGERRGNANVLG